MHIEETAIRHLVFWRNGFQVEDGELKRYDDPAQAQILAEINAGYVSNLLGQHFCFVIERNCSHVPPAVLNVLPGQHVELRVTKRINEDYVPPVGTKTFGGSGHRLGAVVPEVFNSSNEAMPGSFPTGSIQITQSSAPEKAEIKAKFEVDQTLPTTSIQIRLADGTRSVLVLSGAYNFALIRLTELLPA